MINLVKNFRPSALLLVLIALLLSSLLISVSNAYPNKQTKGSGGKPAQGQTKRESNQEDKTQAKEKGDLNKKVGTYLAGEIIPFATQIAIAGAVMMVVFAGFLYITSGGNQDRISQAKQYIEGAILGLITMLSIGLIVKTIFGSIIK